MNDTSAIQPGLFDSDDGALSLETKGHSAEELFRLGVTAAGCGDERKAEHWFQAAARGGHTRAMESLAAIALRHDDPASAERWYRQAVELGDFELAYSFALVLHDQGQSEQAVRALWRGATGQDPRAMVLLGELALRTQESEQAEYWHRAGAALDHGPALYALSLTLAERADYAGAEEAMARAAGAGETRAMGTVGALAEARGQSKEALGWYERGAAGGDQESSDGLRRLGGSGGVTSVRGSQTTSTGSSDPDLFAAFGTGNRLAVAMTLGSGAPVDARGQQGLTVCFLAASWGRAEILPLLIEGGADLEAPDECGNTPLMAAVIGVPLGVFMGSLKIFEAFFEPFLGFIRYMPASAFIPLLILWAGIGEAQKLAVIFIGSFFNLVLMIAVTVGNTRRDLVEAAYTLGVGDRSLIRRVLIPGAAPEIAETLRMVLGWAWTYVIVAELIGASSGIGHMITDSQALLNTGQIIFGIIVIGVIGLISDLAFKALNRRLFAWSTL